VKRFFLRLFEHLLARLLVFSPVREPGEQVVPVLLEASFPVRHDTLQTPSASPTARARHGSEQQHRMSI
jgi:hypothetical protein